MLNYFGTGFSEINALFGKLPLTKFMIQHSLSYPGINFSTWFTA